MNPHPKPDSGQAQGPAPASPFSLRRRLLLLMLGAVTLAWSATAVLSYFDTRSEIGEMLDAQLVQAAQFLLLQTSHEIEEEEISDDDLRSDHKYEHRIAFQIWNYQGNLVMRSSSAPEKLMAAPVDGFSNTTIDGRAWRIFTRASGRATEGKLLVQVGEPFENRFDLAKKIAAHLLFPLLLALPLLAILIWVAVGRGLSPLTRIAEQVAHRNPQHLSPLDTHAAPQEVLPLLDSLNTLFARVQQAFDNERRFTADAAHELRTPLAALKTQAQVAANATSLAGQQTALKQVLAGVDRATHLIEQLLMLARLDPQASLRGEEKHDLHEIAVNCLAEIAPQALAKQIDLSLSGDETVPVAGDSVMLCVLLRNLADNAIRYSPEGGKVEVHLQIQNQAERKSVTLRVTDNGPGIPPDEREKAFGRFYRILGSNESGSGLGLSIVKRIADLHDARVELRDADNGVGLCVVVHFPL